MLSTRTHQATQGTAGQRFSGSFYGWNNLGRGGGVNDGGTGEGVHNEMPVTETKPESAVQELSSSESNSETGLNRPITEEDTLNIQVRNRSVGGTVSVSRWETHLQRAT
jgi:hypothetical protein